MDGVPGRHETTLVGPRVRAAGAAVGAFRLERRLGGGHDTEVWRANGDGIIVALKLLRPGADALARARMAREAAVLATVDHPSIGGLLDAGEEDGEPFLAFTLYEAGTFAARIDRGRVSPAVAAAALAPIADALAYVHERGVVHRDVKPANVLCTVDGPVLIDFSIASVSGSAYDGWIDGAAAVAGTEGYRAPEAGRVAPAPAEDVYALGVTLLEAVTGQRSDVDGAVGPLRELLDSLLSDEPALRPSAVDVAAALFELAGDVEPPVETAPRERDIVAPATALAPRRVARAAEIRRLLEVFDAGVVSNELRGVLVAAPAGSGKSWLIEESARQFVRDHADARVLTARCTDAVGDTTVLQRWLRPLLERDVDPVEALSRVVGSAPARQVARAVGLVHGGGQGSGDAGVVADALAALLASLGPVVCVVEDLHHASLELLDLLARLVLRDAVPGALWCTTRPGFVDADDLDLETLPLGPLDDEALSEVVNAALGVAAPEVVASVVAVAGGNPLHAREAALAAARSGGALDVASLGSLPDLIADRFANLDRRAQDALAFAAACGDAFWPEAVGDALLAGAAVLYREGVAQVRMTSSVAGSTEAGWVHPLLQEVAYSRLAVGERRALHGRLGTVLEGAGAEVEVVARQAGQAFRLGDVASASLAGRAGAAAARDALDRFALSGAASWIALVRDTGHEPVAGVADLLDAELRLARGDFEAAARLVRPLTVRDDDVGSRALVLATEATAGAGDLRTAEQFGERAFARLGNDPQLAASYGAVLARRGRLEEALRLLDDSAESSRATGDEAFAARLEAQAADVAADLAEKEGLPFRDAITRTRGALDALRSTGDRRRFALSVDSLFGMVNIDFPQEAMALAKEAAEVARSLGDEVAYGRAVYRICDAALDLCDVGTFEQWRPELDALPLPALPRAEANLLTVLFDRLRSGVLDRAVEEFVQRAQQMRALGETSPVEAHAAAVCAALWQGRLVEARDVLQSCAGQHLSPVHGAVVELTFRALSGPPWTVPAATGSATTTNPERALLHLLRGERSTADALLTERHLQRVNAVGNSFQRFTPYFPGALVLALRPDASPDDVTWLRGWVFNAPLPGLWIVNRAIAAVLLAERQPSDAPVLARAALALLDSANADERVDQWIRARGQSFLS